LRVIGGQNLPVFGTLIQDWVVFNPTRVQAEGKLHAQIDPGSAIAHRNFGILPPMRRGDAHQIGGT
jgi:hypothetical protein